MENFGDKTRAFLYALLVHAICAAVMFMGLFWTKTATPVNLQGTPIEATLVGITQAPPPRAAVRPRPPPPKPPEPEPPKPQDSAPPPPEPQKNDVVEQERISDMALLKAEQAKKAEEEKHRQEQVKLDQEKKEKETAERDRQKKLAEVQKKLDAAEKARKVEQERLQQLADASKKPPTKAPPQDTPQTADQAKTGNNGNDTSLLAEYSAAIVNVVRLNWNRPDNAQPGLRCTVNVIQLPGGDVMSATAIAPCNADPVTRVSIEQAVTKAQPLPYKGYEKVFSRQITFIFTYDGN